MTSENTAMDVWAERVARRWNLELQQTILDGGDRAVFRVDTPRGPGGLKLNRKLGSEGGAVPFLRGLPDGIAVKLWRVSPLRRAILMEWLDGPTLEDLYHSGRQQEAEKHLVATAAALKKVPFRHAFMFPRLAKQMQNKLDRAKRATCEGPNADLFLRTQRLLHRLMVTTRSETVIHGDLSYRNIILTPDGPRFIDPKGYRADPAMDMALALPDPGKQTDPAHFADQITRRADVFAPEIGESAERLIQWAAVTRAVRQFFRSSRGQQPVAADQYIKILLDLAGA
ncbi:aminoglycoside phosphotransferase family protein [Yoonia sp. 2307UL14-13]|uniref:aminoglycoside phosphotransferase family protein n=1 Tax=Yoonia sp. 2307UL14-13 TaxID=3126506 RepID=UPI0030A57F7B